MMLCSGLIGACSAFIALPQVLGCPALCPPPSAISVKCMFQNPDCNVWCWLFCSMKEVTRPVTTFPKFQKPNGVFRSRRLKIRLFEDQVYYNMYEVTEYWTRFTRNFYSIFIRHGLTILNIFNNTDIGTMSAELEHGFIFPLQNLVKVKWREDQDNAEQSSGESTLLRSGFIRTLT